MQPLSDARTPPALSEPHDAAAFYTLKADVGRDLEFVAEFKRAANPALTTLFKVLDLITR